MNGTEAATYQCWICGNAILRQKQDPLRLVLLLDDEEQQALYAHWRCMKRVADKSVPLLGPSD